ncbi:uncharacterized protein LOC132202649 [Neocloeon triangulifer]|uniref:uncharacterized protein LOC132192499 n=1 Tax=Neocloeon triangulifer TaxID=2078957 RepID=UPI00286F54AC|nr:uncharacterized protein LOC132192499 [Neocloeon triangulifer]XP_059470219.1 uncharacterized protein LOC132193518 [Neocloeon triangulifer]XP_059485671.1 uncharacterized protein LOC132202649 [Neocloeon triangulifer]
MNNLASCSTQRGRPRRRRGGPGSYNKGFFDRSIRIDKRTAKRHALCGISDESESSVDERILSDEDGISQETVMSMDTSLTLDPAAAPEVTLDTVNNTPGSQQIEDSENSDMEEWYTPSCSESSAEDSDNDDFQNYHFGKFLMKDLATFLIDGSQHTLGSALIKICKIFKDNYCSKKLLGDLIEFISEILPPDSIFPKSKHLFMKMMEDISPNNEKPKVKYYCGSCLLDYGGNDKNECPSCKEKRSAIYLENQIDITIRNMFEKKGLSKLIDDYSQFRKDKPPNVIRDIVDSESYLKVNRSSEYDLCLIQNTDGFPVAGSSKTQIWPNFLIISDINPNLRSKFIIMHSIWYAPVKPDMSVFLEEFVNIMEKFGKDGIEWTHPITKEKIISRISVIASSVDAQARGPMQNLNMYNGAHGCSFCEIPGERIEVGIGQARIYPFRTQSYPARSSISMLRNANELMKIKDSEKHLPNDEKTNHRKGVKGYSCMGLLENFDLSKSFSPDYLHSCLLGVVKRHIYTITDSKNRNNDFYIGNFVEVIDKKIKSLCPPNFVKRLPRSLELKKYWKASELRNWLLFFSLPCLQLFWPDRYLNHHSLLVFAIHTLLKNEITTDEICDAKRALKEYCRDYASMYRTCDQTFNLHVLLHYADKVKYLGPLWSHSTFIFESANFRLGQVIHGTGTKVAIEISNTMRIHNFLNILTYLANVDNSSSKHLEIDSLGSALSLNTISSCIVEYARTITLFDDNLPYELNFYLRAKRGNAIFTSEMYLRAERTCSFFVLYDNNGQKIPAKILCFAKSRDRVIFIGHKIDFQLPRFGNSEENLAIKHIVPYTDSGVLIWSYVSRIYCHLIKVEEFLCVPPNVCEINL